MNRPATWLLGLALLAACGDSQSGNVVVPGGGGGGGGGGSDAGGSDAGTRDGGSDGAVQAGVSLLAQTPTVGAMTADAANIYWSSGLVLWRVPKAGGSKVMLATATTVIQGIFVNANGSALYVTTADGGVWKVGATSLMNQADVAAPGSLVLVGGTLFVAGGGGVHEVIPSFSATPFTASIPSSNLVASSAQVFWAETFTRTGNIMTIGAGDPPFSEAVVANDALGAPVQLALGGSNIYWTSQGQTGAIRKVSAGVRGATPQLVLGNLSQPGAIASDGSNVYFSAGGNLARISANAGGTQSAHVIASGQNGIVAILVDASSVYWGTRLDGKLQKAPR